MADERIKAIELTFAQIEKQFCKGSIMRLGSKEAVVPISVIPTGAISFDAALGVGGFLLMPVGPMSGWGDLGWLTVIGGALMLLSGLGLSLKSQVGREVELSAPSWGPKNWGDDEPPPPSEPPPAPPASLSSSGPPPAPQTVRREMVERVQPVFGRRR